MSRRALANPFYLLAPAWALFPLVILASAATVIASQAVISGAFSMTRQAVQLGYLPRLEIRHTSEHEVGQIYVPKLNLFLLVAVLALVLGFKSSDNLGAAYGIAVTGTMTITTILAFAYMRGVLRWNFYWSLSLFGFFLAVDLMFFSANMLKIEEGGWFPLAVAALVYTVMATWRTGRAQLVAARAVGGLPLETFLASIKPDHPVRVPGTAVFTTANNNMVPNALLHNLKHNHVLADRVILMTVITEDIPHVGDDQRLEIRHLDKNFHTITLHYGFMEQPNIPRALAQCRDHAFPVQAAGDVVLRRAREDRRQQKDALLALAQRPVHPDVEHHARRDRVLPHPAQPRHRAGRADRDLAQPRRRLFRLRQALGQDRGVAVVDQRQHVGRRKLGPAGVERRRRRVFDAELDRLCRLLARDLGGNREGEIDPRRDAAAGDEFAVAHDPAIVRNGAEQRQHVPPGPMTGGTLALEQARRAENQRAGADRGDIARVFGQAA